MYPLIRPGDVLHIESRSVREIAVGNIAVFRCNGSLFGHRTIDKQTIDGVCRIITKPDNTVHGDDGPTVEKDVLGIVSSIERKGRRINPARCSYGLYTRRIITLRLKLIEYGTTLRKCLINTIAHCQNHTLYRRGVRLFLKAAVPTPKFEYTVRLPFAGKWETGLYHDMPEQEFDIAIAGQGGKVDRWRLMLNANNKKHPAAFASFVRRPLECPFAGWWLEDMQVRMRYKGFGYPAALIHKAKKILARNNDVLQEVPE